MPNHITNCLEIHSRDKEQIKWLKTCVIDGCLDFQQIIPMPTVIANTVSPLNIVDTQEDADKINAEHGEKVKAMTRDQSDRLLEKHGASNWLDWAHLNWGTKWNAYDGEDFRYTKSWNRDAFEATDNMIVLQFYTAWKPPFGILTKLESMGFEIKGLWKDECDDHIHEFNDDPGTWVGEIQVAFKRYY